MQFSLLLTLLTMIVSPSSGELLIASLLPVSGVHVLFMCLWYTSSGVYHCCSTAEQCYHDSQGCIYWDMTSSLLDAKPCPCSSNCLSTRRTQILTNFWRLSRQSLEGDMTIPISTRYHLLGSRVCWSTRDQHPQGQLCSLTTSGWSSIHCSEDCDWLILSTCFFKHTLFPHRSYL